MNYINYSYDLREMQVTAFISFTFASIAATMIIYLKFAPKKSYFEAVGEQNGIYPAQFPTGPCTARNFLQRGYDCPWDVRDR